MASPARKQSQDIHASPVTSSDRFPPFEIPPRNPLLLRPSQRRGSTASSISSLSSVQDRRNQLVESDQNAISTLLQTPIVRTGLQPHSAAAVPGYKAPTQKDIPPVALTNIRHVDAKAFHPYLAQVGSLYEAFQRAKAEIDGGEASLFHREKKTKAEDWESVLNKKLQRPARSRHDSESSLVISPTETPRLSRRSSGQKRQAVTPLSTIPQVYSEEDFHLENPRTFDIVSERSEVVRDPNATPSGRKSLATNAILQEKLSWYMDTVEVHLISSISTASKSFFSALGSLRELHAEAEDSVARIQKLRKELARLDKEMAVDGLKVVNLKQRRDNVRRLSAAILQLQDIATTIQACQTKAHNEELDETLDEIDYAERLMSGSIESRSYQPQDLRLIRALDGAQDDLNTLRSQAGRGYESRFHNNLLGDMRMHVSSTEQLATLQRWGAAFNRSKPGQRRPQSTVATYMNLRQGFRDDLEKEMRGLSRAKFTTAAVTTFRALVLREMKSMIRKQLPSSNDDDNMSTVSASTYGGRRSQQEKSSLLARNLRALDDGDWYQMLVKIYTSISESLRRLSIQVKILLDVTSGIDQPQSAAPKSPTMESADTGNALSPRLTRPRSISIQAEMQQALDLSNLLGEAVDAAHTQITKVLKVRSPQISDMPLEDFIRYFTLNKLFANECEAISGRSGAGLKTVLDLQIKEYVNQFGNRQRHSMVEVLDADKWEAKDFNEARLKLLSRVIEGSTSEAAAWIESGSIWLQGSSVDDEVKDNIVNGVQQKIRSAEIDEQKFILSESPMAMLTSIEQFEHLTMGVPTMGQEIVASLLETLKLFNSRTSQLILGAGATRSAGLKNITTKHLALSSQGLSFVIALIPYIREFFRRYVPASSSGQSMMEFDKVKRLFQEHQHGIHEKLVDIMSNRSAIHVRAMKTVDWEKAAQDSTVKVSSYMETLTKETATLQKVLSKHLPEVDVMSIMIPVFESYRKQWQTAYDEVELASASAKERMLADARAFEARIGKLEGAGDLGSHIAGIVEAKQVTVSASTPAQPPTLSITRNSMENRVQTSANAESEPTSKTTNTSQPET